MNIKIISFDWRGRLCSMTERSLVQISMVQATPVCVCVSLNGCFWVLENHIRPRGLSFIMLYFILPVEIKEEEQEEEETVLTLCSFRPSGIQKRPSADLRRPSPTVEEPAPAPQRGPAAAAADASHPLTEARGAGGTPSWTSPSTRPSTPPEERLATSWTRRSGRGEAGVHAAVGIREDGSGLHLRVQY